MRKITVSEVMRTRTGGVQLIYKCDCRMKRHLHGGGNWEEFQRKLQTNSTISFGSRVSHCDKHKDEYELVYDKTYLHEKN